MADRGEAYKHAKRRAVAEALQVLATQWRHKFSPAAVQAELPLWFEGCEHAATAFIVPAARKIVATARGGAFPPKPGDLCDMARTLERQAASSTTTPATTAAALIAQKNLKRINLLGRRAFDRLGSWDAVDEVWGLLARTASTDAEFAAIRDGSVTDQVFDEALAVVAAKREAA